MTRGIFFKVISGFFLVIAMLMICEVSTVAQGGYYRDNAFKFTGVSLLPAGGVSITVCAAAAVGVPCSPQANLFSNSTLTTPLSQPLTTDSLGNFSFYATPGLYVYTINGTGITNQGPFTINVISATGDFPEVAKIPAANCNNATGGNGWSIGGGGTVACRAGTNNLGGYIAITDTASTFAQFGLPIPVDWDTAKLPYIRFQIASTDTTSGHTIIPQIKISCAKGDGSTTDDVTFNAAHSLSTITLNTTANQFWATSNVQMNAADVTGCIGGSWMIVQVGRATDTATSALFYGAAITFPRAVTLQAN